MDQLGEPLVSADEVAKHFGVTVGTVNGWVRRGLVPFVRPSRRIVRFRLSDIEAALERGGQSRKPARPEET